MSRTAVMEKVGKKIVCKGFLNPDEIRNFPKGRLEILHLAGACVGRAVLEPGWKWSESVKPIVKTRTCEAPHFQYHVSGTLRIHMEDGTVKDCKAGDVSWVAAGHDAWVVGQEPVVLVDFQGMLDYAKQKRRQH